MGFAVSCSNVLVDDPHEAGLPEDSPDSFQFLLVGPAVAPPPATHLKIELSTPSPQNGVARNLFYKALVVSEDPAPTAETVCHRGFGGRRWLPKKRARSEELSIVVGIQPPAIPTLQTTTLLYFHVSSRLVWPTTYR